MTYIKIYQKVDPRFRQEQKILRESKVLHNSMESLLESWHSYTSTELLNEGLQDVIFEKLKKMAATFINKIKQINNLGAIPFNLEDSKELNSLNAQIKKVVGSINSITVDEQLKESIFSTNSKFFLKTKEDRQYFDKVLRESKQKKELNEAVVALAATIAHSPALALIATIPFLLITIGKILILFGLEKVGNSLIAAGEVIERIERSVEELVSLPASYYFIDKIIENAKKGNKLCQFLLPKESVAYWSNPKVPKLKFNEYVEGKTFASKPEAIASGFIDRLSTGVKGDIEHSMHSHLEMPDKTIINNLLQNSEESFYLNFYKLLKTGAAYVGREAPEISGLDPKERNKILLQMYNFFLQPPSLDEKTTNFLKSKIDAGSLEISGIKAIKKEYEKRLKLVKADLAKKIEASKEYKSAKASGIIKKDEKAELEGSVEPSEERKKFINLLRNKVNVITQLLILLFVVALSSSKLQEIMSKSVEKIKTLLSKGTINLAKQASAAAETEKAVDGVVKALEEPAEATHAIEAIQKTLSALFKFKDRAVTTTTAT